MVISYTRVDIWFLPVKKWKVKVPIVTLLSVNNTFSLLFLGCLEIYWLLELDFGCDLIGFYNYIIVILSFLDKHSERLLIECQVAVKCLMQCNVPKIDPLSFMLKSFKCLLVYFLLLPNIWLRCKKRWLTSWWSWTQRSKGKRLHQEEITLNKITIEDKVLKITKGRNNECKTCLHVIANNTNNRWSKVYIIIEDH